MEEETQESIKNVSDKWLDRIFNSLTTLEYYERQLRMGYQGLSEYLESLNNPNPEGTKVVAQVQATAFLLNEYEMLFNNVETEIEKGQMKILRDKLKLCKEIWVGKHGEVVSYKYARRRGERIAIGGKFHSNFFEIIDLFSEMRRILISNLSHILFIQNKIESKKQGEV